MAEPRLNIVKRDLKGVAKVMRGMEARLACFPDLVQVVGVVSRDLELCVSELEALQSEYRNEADCLGDHLFKHERLEKRVSDLETQAGLAKVME